MPEAVNEEILSLPPYNATRGTRRITNAEEADAGFAVFDIVERGDRHLATLTLTVDV